MVREGVGGLEAKEARAIFALCIGKHPHLDISPPYFLFKNTACFTTQRQKDCIDCHLIIFGLPDFVGLNHICKTFRLIYQLLHQQTKHLQRMHENT